MPVRKPKKNYRSLTGMFYSLKNQKGIFFESKLERDLFLTLEFDKKVISYEEQPIQIAYKNGQKTYPYTPDCLVHYKEDISCIIEVKYSNELEEKKDFFDYKFTQIETILQDQDYSFKVFTEKDVDPVILKNMSFIYNYVTIRDETMIKDIYSKILNIGSLPYMDLLHQLSPDKHKQALYTPYIWHLVLTGKLTIDFSKKITPQTYIEVLA